ncbi:MAG: flavocytochrome c [Bacillota bacterium]|nr:flavocytochrome c [Bacillota bacterium]
MKNNQSKGMISLIVTVAMMFAVVFGVKVVGSSTASTSSGSSVLSTVADGTYSGDAKGFGGDIHAEVTITGGQITDVTVVGDGETPSLGGVAIEKIPGRVLEAQSLNVDLVSGATVSSNAIMEALRKAFESAGVNPDDLTGNAATGQAVEKKEETLDCDVVIVGAGGAGMAAAITAKQEGKNVILIDKMPYVGGNTTKASGGMNAAGTKVQKANAEKEEDADVKAAIEDSTVENYIEDTINGGHGINDRELVTKMAELSSEAVDWLESIGAPLPALAATGGTVHYYLHEPEDGSAVGEFLVEHFSATLAELGIEVMVETEAKEILMKDGKAAGIKAEGASANYTINAKAVVLATGGFGANFDMLAEYDESLSGAVTTNTPAATGDGIVMAEAVGADTVDMEYIQLHPTVHQETSMLVSERLRSNGAILINKEGNRFTNDLATRDAVSQAELKQTDSFAFICYDSKYEEEKLYQKYVNLGLTVQGDTLEDLAKEMGLEGDAVNNFIKAVEAWNKVCAKEAEDQFGRNNGLISMDEGPFFAIKIAPGVHHTMGGLKINTSTEVLSKDGKAIPGLFAAGEVTGGVHGGNRIGGNAVADIVVYGRVAGKNAADYASK